MKKLLFLTIIVCAVTALVFADNFTVQSVTGRVEQESGNQRVEVRVGEVLDGNVILHTGVGAALVVRDESGRSITIAAARNGSLTELTKVAAPAVRVGGTIARTDTGAASRTSANVGTASARASTSVIDVQAAAPKCSFCTGSCDNGCDDGCDGACNN